MFCIAVSYNSRIPIYRQTVNRYIPI
jgi:hypothetical protein